VCGYIREVRTVPEGHVVSSASDGTSRSQGLARNVALDLSRLIGELNAVKADANHWLEGAEYSPLKLRLEAAHAAAEAALIEARRRARLNEAKEP
jgi:hypothetical protein